MDRKSRVGRTHIKTISYLRSVGVTFKPVSTFFNKSTQVTSTMLCDVSDETAIILDSHVIVACHVKCFEEQKNAPIKHFPHIKQVE